jgi:hypothetical protein
VRPTVLLHRVDGEPEFGGCTNGRTVQQCLGNSPFQRVLREPDTGQSGTGPVSVNVGERPLIGHTAQARSGAPQSLVVPRAEPPAGDKGSSLDGSVTRKVPCRRE